MLRGGEAGQWISADPILCLAVGVCRVPRCLPDSRPKQLGGGGGGGGGSKKRPLDRFLLMFFEAGEAGWAGAATIVTQLPS